ncbi:MAG: biopolymer transporter ExbD [Bacteroidia bacterium]|nr:biopolymer transporter ExbD [Bacteroidia bacterium]
MPKVKPKRHVPVIDMTAMVDVAFLLLTFFILTTTFRPDEKVVVDTPSSTSTTEITPTDMMTINVDATGRCFVGFADIPSRAGVLDKIEADYGFTASAEGRQFFILQTSVGVPLKEIATWLSGTKEQMKEYEQKGVQYPYFFKDPADNDLKRWILYGRTANVRTRFAIKGDQNSPYPAIQDVISTLQDWNINKFNLITDLEAAPGGEGAE